MMTMVLLAMALAGEPAPAAGLVPVPADPRELVVTGQRGRDRRSEMFVDAIVQPSQHDQIARFEDPLCPTSIGLAGQDAGIVERRIRAVAEAADVRTAKPGCRPNLVILVVDDRARAVAHWQKTRPDFFETLTKAEVAALTDGSGPVAAWQIVHLKGADRRPVGRTDDGVVDYYVQNQVVPTRIGTTIQFEFYGSFLLVEASALQGKTLMQLADYAAMRTLARTDDRRGAAQPMPTILSLFGPDGADAAPPSLTHWDLGFLTGLYRLDPAFRANEQRKAIAHSLRRHVASAPADAADE